MMTSTAAANDPTRATLALTAETSTVLVPAASGESLASEPTSPTEPAPAPSPALTSGASTLSILAAVSETSRPIPATGASTVMANFSPPSSPAFDNDTSPD